MALSAGAITLDIAPNVEALTQKLIAGTKQAAAAAEKQATVTPTADVSKASKSITDGTKQAADKASRDSRIAVDGDAAKASKKITDDTKRAVGDASKHKITPEGDGGKAGQQVMAGLRTHLAKIPDAVNPKPLGDKLVAGLTSPIGKIGSMLAGAFTVGSITKFASDSVNAFKAAASEAKGLQKVIGGTLEDSSRWNAVAAASGVSADKFAGSLKILERNAQKMSESEDKAGQKAFEHADKLQAEIEKLEKVQKPTADQTEKLGQLREELASACDESNLATSALSKLGIAFTDQTGKVKPMNDLLPQIADKFKELPNGTEKTALAMKLFGRQGVDMIPMLSKGSEGLKELGIQAEKSGNVINDKMAAQTTKAMLAQRAFDQTMKGLKVTVGAELLPVMTNGTIWMQQHLLPVILSATSYVKAHKSEFEKLGKALAASVMPIAERLGKFLAEKLVPAFASLAGFVSRHTKLFEGLAVGVLGVAVAFSAVSKAMSVVSSVQSLASGFKKVGEAADFAKVKTIAHTAATKTAAAAQKAWTVATNLFKAAWAGSPLGVIVLGITALVVAFKLAYDHVGWFHRAVDKALKGVKDVAESVVDWFKNTAWPTLKHVVSSIGDAFTWVYEKVIRPAWKGIGDAIGATVDWFAHKAWPAIKGAVNSIADAFTWVYEKIIKPVWDGIQTAIRVVTDWIVDHVTALIKAELAGWGVLFRWLRDDVIKPVWDGIQTTIRVVTDWLRDHVSKLIDNEVRAWGALFTWVKEEVIEPVWNGIQEVLSRGADAIKTTFTNLVEGVRKIWDGLKDIAKAPVKFVVETVINKGLIAGWNSLDGMFHIGHMNDVALPQGFATGGYIDLPWSAQHRDPYIGQTAQGKVFRFEGEEFIVNRQQTQKHRQLLEALNAGHLDGYADGGVVGMERIRQAIRKGMGGGLTAAADAMGAGDGGQDRVRPVPYPSSGWGSYPGHKGLDFPAPTGTPISNFMAGEVIGSGWDPLGTTGFGNAVMVRMSGSALPYNPAPGLLAIYGHMSQAIARVGQMVGAGSLLGYVGSTGNSTGPHLHFELQNSGQPFDPTGMLGGAAAPPPGAGAVENPIITGIRKLLHGILSPLDKIGDNPFAQAVAHVPRQMVDKVLDWAVKKFGGTGSGTTPASGWRDTVAQALQMNGLPATDAYVEAWLRQIQTESGGNPNAVQGALGDANNASGDLAKGLVQVIGSTFNAFKFPGHDNIFDGLDNLLAGINYAKSRYGADGMLGVIGRGHGYANGTLNAARGYAWVGERGPELVDFNGGERVFNEAQLADLGRRGMTKGGHQIVFAPVIEKGEDVGRQFERFQWDLVHTAQLAGVVS